MSAEPQISVLLDFIKEISPRSVLEVGCNSGRELNVIPGVRRYGVDKNPEGLSRVQGKTYCCDANKTPFKTSQIDLVYSMGCLGHNEDPLPILEEMFRVAKKYVVLVEWIGTRGSGGGYGNCKSNTWIHDYERLCSLKGELCFNRKMNFGADLFHVLVLRKKKPTTTNRIVISEVPKEEYLFSIKLGKYIVGVKKNAKK